MTDWNWFFSSVAQSAAAIVGILGAFIISNVLGNRAEYERKIKLSRALIVDSESFVREASKRYFDWYNSRVFEREINDIEGEIEDGAAPLTETQYYDEGAFSIFASRSETIEKIKVDLRGKIEAIEQEARERRMLGPFGASAGILTGRSLSRLISRVDPAIEKERDLINEYVIRLQRHCDLVKGLISEVEGNPESSPLVRITLILILVLFSVGVIYPLSFMPMAVGQEVSLSFMAFFDVLLSIRGFILSSIACAFTFVIYKFYEMNTSLIYQKELIDKLMNFSDPSNYSEYLKNMTDNTLSAGA